MGSYEDRYASIEAQKNAERDVVEVPKYNHELDVIREVKDAILRAAEVKLPTKYEKLSKDGVKYVAWEVCYIYDSYSVYLVPDNGQLYKGLSDGYIIETSHVQSLYSKQRPTLNLGEVTELRVNIVKYAIENGVAIKDSWGNEPAIKNSLANTRPKGFFSKLFGTT